MGTRYLDGLRGVFSFIVFVRHFLVPWEPTIDTGFSGKGNLTPDMSVLKLPFVRILYSGPTVPVFFVVSGFLLAHKPLRLAHNGEMENFLNSISSSIFRRALRLFLPPAISTFLVALAVRFGAYNAPYGAMPGQVPQHPERFDSFTFQMTDWIRFVVYELTQLWNWEIYDFKYDTHLYTVPIQFRSSIIIFVLLTGLARVTARLRMVILVFIWLFLQQQRRWDVGLFVAGVIIRAACPLPECSELQITSVTETPKGRVKNNWRRIFWRFLFVLGLYLGSFPRGDGAAELTPGYAWLSTLTKKFTIWHSYGATAILCALSHDRDLQEIFMNSWFYYLGKISFSLYLVHGPMLHIYGYSFTAKLLSLVDQTSPFQYQGIIFISLIFTTIPVLWAADLFWRVVDRSCGTAVARLERACFQS
ncbi:hypothetical protein NLG97_g6772 [Lecanicillium saksenae]|uniref:Uncharacterized protein n=2 Tax=Lecanicillium saksenae TaxID=468837 RepID=A0ACC1QQJ4_9HYPO|nr:hypothetical protein NLG97_g7282 [Lecanicillium saksenae]KAJ3485638.1 hypothetical protein NLG97_g6772 [Lecanicillium saksenae]